MYYLKDNIREIERVEEVLDLEEVGEVIQVKYAGVVKYHFKAPTMAYKNAKRHTGVSCSVRVRKELGGYILGCDACKDDIIGWQKRSRDKDPQNIYIVGIVRDAQGIEHMGTDYGVYIALYMEAKYGGSIMVTRNEVTQEKDYWVVLGGKIAVNHRGEVLDLQILRKNNTISEIVTVKTREKILKLLDKEGVVYDDIGIQEDVAAGIERETIKIEITTYQGERYESTEYKEIGNRVRLGEVELGLEEIKTLKIERVC